MYRKYGEWKSSCDLSIRMPSLTLNKEVDSMKKFGIALITALMLMSATVFAHPKVPPQSLNKVNENAAHGMHTAWGNVQNAKGVASHVFLMRHSPH